MRHELEKGRFAMNAIEEDGQQQIVAAKAFCPDIDGPVCPEIVG